MTSLISSRPEVQADFRGRMTDPDTTGRQMTLTRRLAPIDDRLTQQVRPAGVARGRGATTRWLTGLVIGVTALLGQAGPLLSAVTIFPAPGLPHSEKYAVRIQTENGWQDSFVYMDRARASGNGSRDEAGRTFSWTTFQTTQAVRVRVERLSGAFSGVLIRPRRFDVQPTPIDDRTVEFSISPGQKLSVEFDTAIKSSCFTGPPNGIPCVIDALMIFADLPRESDPLSAYAEGEIHRVEPGVHQELVPVAGLGVEAGRATLGDLGHAKAVVFAPGVHKLGYWQVPGNVTHIHFLPGAIVYGALDVLPEGVLPGQPIDYEAVYRRDWSKQKLRSSFRITGPGILCGAELPWHLKKDFTYTERDDWWAHVRLVQLAAENVEVEDVTLVNSPYWVLSFINDADPRVRGTLDNFKMIGAWTYNNDGLPTPNGKQSRISNAFIHADDDALKIYGSGSTIENCTIWQANNGAVFQFGWFPKSVSDVTVRNIDVIHFENWYGMNQSNRAVFNYADAGGPGTIERITFDGVRVEGKILRLFGFKAMGKQVLRDWRFSRLQCDGMGAGQVGPPGRNYFIGDITRFEFDDFMFDGKRVGANDEAQFDLASGAGGGFVFRHQPSGGAAE